MCVENFEIKKVTCSIDSECITISRKAVNLHGTEVSWSKKILHINNSNSEMELSEAF